MRVISVVLRLAGPRGQQNAVTRALLRYLTRRTGANGSIFSPRVALDDPPAPPATRGRLLQEVVATTSVAAESFHPLSEGCVHLAADEPPVSMYFEDVDMAVVEQALQEIVSGDQELFTEDGVPVGDTICSAVITLSFMPIDNDAATDGSRTDKGKTVLIAVASVLIALVALVVGVYQVCRRRGANKGTSMKVANALPPPSPAGGVVTRHDSNEDDAAEDT